LRSGPERDGFVANDYECSKCRFIVTTVDPDPLKMAEEWLNGELNPPKNDN